MTGISLKLWLILMKICFRELFMIKPSQYSMENMFVTYLLRNASLLSIQIDSYEIDAFVKNSSIEYW
jgi:hypothetical protein